MTVKIHSLHSVRSAHIPCAARGLDAVQMALEQIDLIHRFVDWQAPHMQLARSAQQIAAAHQSGVFASLIGVEGGHALGSSLAVLRSLYALGVRYLTLTHDCDSQWATAAVAANTVDVAEPPAPAITVLESQQHSTQQQTTTQPPPPPPTARPPEKGLSTFGRAVVREMNRLGMMIDLAHASDATVRDVLRESRAPVIFSHTAARSLCNRTLNVPDSALRDVADNGGIVMLSFDSAQVACVDSTRPAPAAAAAGATLPGAVPRRRLVATMRDVIAHINHVRSIAGVRHIGIGAGYDGIRSVPAGLEDVSAYPRLFAELLRDPAWSEEDLHLLAGQNVLRVLRSVETVRDYLAETSVAPVEQLLPRQAGACTSRSL